MPQTAIVWFRNDLRLRDHEALAGAARAADRVLPVYCFDPRHFGTTRWGGPKTGARRARFLLESLADLRTSLQGLGADLVVRRGRPEDVLLDLARRYDASAVYVHEEVTSEETDVEAAVERALDAAGVAVRSCWGHTLYHRDDIPFEAHDVPAVFTAFRKAVETHSAVRRTLPVPDRLAPLPDGLAPGPLPSVAGLGLEEPPFDERAVLAFTGGERAGLNRLESYIWDGDHLRRYKETRNGLLGADYSSKLSAWLAHGCLSPRTIYEEVNRYERQRVKNSSTYWLVFELIWRDFFRPEGAYVRRWVPALRGLPAGLVHEPYRMSPVEQQRYGVVVGQAYPAPMIDLEASYRRLRAGG